MTNTTDIKSLLNELLKKRRSMIITLPSSVNWEDYEKEIDKVKNYKQVMNFKVHNFPCGITVGDRCYIVHRGFIRGWMEIVGFSEKDFSCTTTGKKWRGKFVERSGPFHYIEENLPYKGFQGFRYFDLEQYKKENDL